MGQTYENKPMQEGRPELPGSGLPGFSLTGAEAALVSDPSWIRTKNRVMEKAQLLLGSLHQEMALLPSLLHFPHFPSGTLERGPKISRGESYQGLPYCILDFPRSFSRQDVFALRTMMWWGNFFSCTLHVAGASKPVLEENLIRAALERAEGGGWLICVHPDPWQHHGAGDNYQALESLKGERIKELIREKSFCKLSQQVPLEQWDRFLPMATRLYDRLLGDLGR